MARWRRRAGRRGRQGFGAPRRARGGRSWSRQQVSGYPAVHCGSGDAP